MLNKEVYVNRRKKLKENFKEFKEIWENKNDVTEQEIKNGTDT